MTRRLKLVLIYAFLLTSCLPQISFSKTPYEKWTDAKTKCTMLPRGRLASEINSAIYNIITNLLEQASKTVTWIAGYDVDRTDSHFSTASYRWMLDDGEERSIDHYRSFWASSNPNNPEADYDCILRWRDTGWKDDLCSGAKSYVCQYDSPTQAYDLVETGKKGNNNTQITSFTSTSNQISARRSQCATACGKEIFCYSFSINESTGRCILHWDIGLSPEDLPEVNADYKLFSRVP